jgi:hypothetical protein
VAIDLTTELAKAKATVEALQATQKALIARISPDPGGAQTAHDGNG